MIKTVFLVPVRDNCGNEFPASLVEELEQQLLQFGGFSQRNDVSGAWEFQGTVYRDTSKEFTVSLQSWTQLEKWLNVVQWAKEKFRQEAIYIEVAGVPEIIGQV